MKGITQTQADEFDSAVAAVTAKLDVVMEWHKYGVRYEAICFDGDDLVSVSAKAPLKPGQTVKPNEITVRGSVELASSLVSAIDALPDGSGNVLAEAKWYRLISQHLEAYGAP